MLNAQGSGSVNGGSVGGNFLCNEMGCSSMIGGRMGCSKYSSARQECVWMGKVVTLRLRLFASRNSVSVTCRESNRSNMMTSRTRRQELMTMRLR